MGYYVNVEAKKGCAGQINRLWAAQGFTPALIYTPALIRREIKALHANPQFAHLSYIQTVTDWNKTFPIIAENRGQIFIGAITFEASEHPEEAALLRRQVQFVLDNRFLFERITGLADAEDALEMEVPGEYIDSEGKPRLYDVPTFDKLPAKPVSKLYRLCLAHNRPDIWADWLQFEASPSFEAWCELRTKIVPWNTAHRRSPISGETVWYLCERQATQRDGKDYGLEGRYRDGKYPTVFDIRLVLQDV